MAEPITWRSLAGPMPQVDPARSIMYTQQALNDGFASLNKVLENRQAIDASNWEAVKQNNTQDFLDKLAAFRTPEDFAAAQSSGAIDALRAGFGAQIDRAQTRNAAENRLATLYQQARQAGEYQDYTTDRNQLPIMEQIRALAADGSEASVAQANALIAAHPELRHIGQAAENVSNGQRANIEFGWKGDKREEEAKAAADALRSAEVNRRVALASSANDAARLKLQQEQQKFLSFKQGQDLLTEAQAGAAAVNDNLISSPKGSKQVLDTIDKMVPRDSADSKDAYESLVRYVGQAMADPRNKYMTVDQLLGLALNTKDDRLWGTRWARDGNRGQTLEASLAALRSSPDYVAQANTIEGTRARKQNEILALRAALGYDKAGTPGVPAAGATGGGQTVVVNSAPAQAPAGAPAPVAAPVAPAIPAAPVVQAGPASAASQFKQALLGAAPPAAGAPQPAPLTQNDVTMERLVQVERNQLNAGGIKEFSPDVKEYLAKKLVQEAALNKAIGDQAQANTARIGLGSGPLPGVGPTQMITNLTGIDPVQQKVEEARAAQQATADSTAAAAQRKIQAAELQARTLAEIASRNRAPDTKVMLAKFEQQARELRDQLDKAKKAK